MNKKEVETINKEGVLSTESSTSCQKKKSGNRFILIAIVLFILLAAGFLGYPLVAQVVNNIWAHGSVVEYNNQVDSMSKEERNEIIKEAELYNKNASNSVKDPFSHTEEDENYEEVLNVVGDGQMGTIVIPCINCELPIYHTTNDDHTLDKGAVHLINTALPIGGKGNHCAISAHTALPGKELFNRLDEMEEGDIFYITVLDVTRAYKVTEINVVEPDNVDGLQRVPGRDLCTLITCTPYAVNTHRLLVTGERSPENDKDLATLLEESKNPIIEYLWVIILVCVIILIIVIIAIITIIRKGKRNKREELGEKDNFVLEENK